MLSSKVLQGLEHDWQALFLIHRFGWLRAHEIAHFLWPNNTSQDKYSERLMRKLTDKQFVLQRRLPHRAGMANVLSKLGAEHLQQGGVENARSGKDIGSISGDQWTAPRDWRHSLLVAGFLGLKYEHAALNEKPFEFQTELEIKKNIFLTQYIDKVPDALFLNEEGQWTWLEVENTRKSGKKHMGNLANSLIEIYQYQPKFFGKKCTEIAIAYPSNSLNELGHQVNHFFRISNAIASEMKIDERIWIDFYSLHLRGFAAIGFDYSQESISGNQVSSQPIYYQGKLKQENWDDWYDEYGYEYEATYNIYETDIPFHKIIISKVQDSNGKLHWKFLKDDQGLSNANPSLRIYRIEYEGLSSSVKRAEEEIFKVIQSAQYGTLKQPNPKTSEIDNLALKSITKEKNTSIFGRMFKSK